MSSDRSSDLFEKMLLEDDDEERAMIRARYVGALRRESAEAVEDIKRRGKRPPVSRKQAS